MAQNNSGINIIRIVCVVMLYIVLSIVFSACSAVKKSSFKEIKKADSTHVTKDFSEVKKDSLSTKKTDSTGTTTKTTDNTYTKDIFIDFGDSTVSINGNAQDFSFKGKIKSVKIHESGTQKKQETQTVNKTSKDSTILLTSQLQAHTDSSTVKTSETTIETKKTKFSLYWLLLLIIPATIFVYVKRNKIKPTLTKLFFGKPKTEA